jgi:hypothetical protein
MRDVSNRRHHFKTSRRKLTAEFTRDNIGRELRTNFIFSGEFLAGHPDEGAISAAISWWRAGAARDSDKVCFACRTIFGVGRANPGAFLVSIGANASDATIGALCTSCLRENSDREIDAAATLMLRRILPPVAAFLIQCQARSGHEARTDTAEAHSRPTVARGAGRIRVGSRRVVRCHQGDV